MESILKSFQLTQICVVIMLFLSFFRQISASWTKYGGVTIEEYEIYSLYTVNILKGFEAAFSALRPEIKHFRIHKKCYFPVKFVVSANIFFCDCRIVRIKESSIRQELITFVETLFFP